MSLILGCFFLKFDQFDDLNLDNEEKLIFCDQVTNADIMKGKVSVN